MINCFLPRLDISSVISFSSGKKKKKNQFYLFLPYPWRILQQIIYPGWDRKTVLHSFLSVISYFLCKKDYFQEQFQSNEYYCPRSSPCTHINITPKRPRRDLSFQYFPQAIFSDFWCILYFHRSHYHLSLPTDFLQGSESPAISIIPISACFGAATTSQCFDAQKCFAVKFYLLRILTTFAIFKKWDKTISEVLTKAGDTFVN